MTLVNSLEIEIIKVRTRHKGASIVWYRVLLTNNIFFIGLVISKMVHIFDIFNFFLKDMVDSQLKINFN